MNDLLHRALSKQFALAVLTLASAHWLCASKHIADGVYSAVVIAVVAAFIVGDAFGKRSAP